jgi:hypothetical protein
MSSSGLLLAPGSELCNNAVEFDKLAVEMIAVARVARLLIKRSTVALCSSWQALVLRC